MENEDAQSVSKNEIDASTQQDTSSEETASKTCAVVNYDSRKLKASLLKLNLGMPEESGGAADSEKDLRESSPSAEKKINGEVTESVPKENGSSTGEVDHEMAPLSIDVEEEGRTGDGKKVESSLKRKLEDTSNLQDTSSSDEEAHSNSPVEFRGFKKRMIAKAEKSLHRQRQVSETENCQMTVEASPVEESSVAETEYSSVENTRVLRSSSKMSGANDKESGDQLTEYAQYLGLQPTVKFKCYRCGEKNFQTMAALNDHQTNCSKATSNTANTAAKPLLSPQIDPSNPSTNFRITRKVFLCSACGTYYENWKLFLHMREVHKRHICLYCLGMFAAADKLAEHLVLKHKITYTNCDSPEEFLSISKGSGYLTCITCERIFTERENFFHHECSTATVTNCSKESTQVRTTEQSNITLNRNSQFTAKAGSTIVINQSSSSTASGSVSKRFVSVPTLVRENWSGKPPPSSDFIDASSFCRVDLNDANSDSSRKPPPLLLDKNTIVVSDDDEEPSSTQSTKPPAPKAILKMFPTLRRLSDLMEKKDLMDLMEKGSTSKTVIETPTKENVNLDKKQNSQPDLKNKKPTQIELPQARKNPLRLTRSTRSASSAVSNSLATKKKTQVDEPTEESSSSGIESIDMNLAKEIDAISEEVEDGSRCVAVSKNIVQNDKSPKPINNTLDKNQSLFAHSPPLLMEVVNESDNESLDEEEPVSNRCVTASNPVHFTSNPEENRKMMEVNKIVIGDIVEKKIVEVKDSKTEEPDKDREEKKVDETNKAGDIDKNKELEKSQNKEDENKRLEKSPVEEDELNLSEKSHTEKPVKTNSDSVVEKVVPNGPSSISRERSIVPYEDSENEEESEDDDDDHPAKEIEECKEEPDKVDNESNVEHDKVENKSNEEHNKVGSDDESIVESDKVGSDDESNVEHDKVDDKFNDDRVDSDESSVENDEVGDESNDVDKVDDESSKEHDEVNNESKLEHNKVEDKSDNESNTVDGESKDEPSESNGGNNEEKNESNENGVTESANENNHKSSKNEDNESVDSDDSDKLSVALSEDSSDDENSKSENDVTENRNVTKSNEDNAVHSESESQAMTNHSEELMNGGNDESESQKAEDVMETSFSFEGETLQIASKEVMAMALTLEDKMESLSAQSVIKECIRTSCTTCGYCNHAVKIGVNGKQLAAHLLAEHRYKPVKNETVQDVIDRLKHALSELKDVWFNTDSYDSSDKSCFVSFDHTYECFQCNFVTNMLKDLISHKRKVHQKTILYCSMCKANFYSYSELLCHMCPGLYVSEDIQFRCCFCEIDRIPSAFRLMVHLRKTHHTCDVCLEIPGDQQKLSTHMWKHKLHHICYRCGIAYRNKPDITKHLFWKHGTESVLCKKCLQKKWPHVYHFCIPPTVFICEECNISFSRAVALKVHKRIHAADFPYSCTECSKKFVSRKILDKHIESHREPVVQNEVDKNETAAVTNRSDECKEAETESVNKTCDNRESEQVDGDNKNSAEKKHEQSEEHLSKSHKKKNKKDRDKKSKPVVDVYDLPPLNLSSESDDSEDEINSTKTADNISTPAAVSSSNLSSLPVESISELKDPDVGENEEHSVIDGIDSNVTSAIVTEPTETFNTSEDNLQSAPVVDGIWDNFHFYKAEQEKRENSDPNSKPPRLPYPLSALPDEISTAIILGDHDYCLVPTDKQESTPLTTNSPSNSQLPREHSSSMDHDYCTVSNVSSKSTRNDLENCERSTIQVENKSPASTPKKKQKSPKKSDKHNSSSSSDSSSDSDSSSCSNSNCSCCSSGSGSSSSSSSDSDSSSSEGKRGKRDRKKEKTKSKKKDDSLTAAPDVQEKEEEPVVDLPVEPEEPPIRESDLDTDESSTDEDFYDQYPQRHANQMLAEKRNQLMVLATVAPVNNGISSPPPEEIPPTPISAPPILQSSSPVPVAVEQNTPKANPVQRRGGRKKRRRVGGQTKNQNITTPSSQFTYDSQPSTSFGLTTPSVSTPVSQYSTPQQNSTARKKARPSVESDSSKRLSKRRRVPNKFYGYSSDEEEEIQQAQRPSPAAVTTAKWRRVEETPPQPEPVRYRVEESVPQYEVERPPVAATAVASSSAAGSSSSNSSGSSGSESDSEPDPIAPPPAVVVNQPRTDKDEKLYCYCQCPYDEVSEMIACDGHDCTIEWFHFECVGIMVPPKGKWFCPDCKRRRNLI